MAIEMRFKGKKVFLVNKPYLAKITKASQTQFEKADLKKVKKQFHNLRILYLLWNIQKHNVLCKHTLLTKPDDLKLTIHPHKVVRQVRQVHLPVHHLKVNDLIPGIRLLGPPNKIAIQILLIIVLLNVLKMHEHHIVRISPLKVRMMYQCIQR
jgi:hypothetical protein